MARQSSLRVQTGVGMMGWLLIIGVALFFVLIGLKMVPTYLENYSIKQVLASMEEDRTLREKSRGELKKIVLKRFKINSVYQFNKDNIKVTSEKGAKVIDIAYEVRKPVAGNVAIVMDFKEQARIAQ